MFAHVDDRLVKPTIDRQIKHGNLDKAKLFPMERLVLISDVIAFLNTQGITVDCVITPMDIIKNNYAPGDYWTKVLRPLEQALYPIYNPMTVPTDTVVYASLVKWAAALEREVTTLARGFSPRLQWGERTQPRKIKALTKFKRHTRHPNQYLLLIESDTSSLLDIAARQSVDFRRNNPDQFKDLQLDGITLVQTHINFSPTLIFYRRHFAEYQVTKIIYRMTREQHPVKACLEIFLCWAQGQSHRDQAKPERILHAIRAVLLQLRLTYNLPDQISQAICDTMQDFYKSHSVSEKTLRPGKVEYKVHNSSFRRFFAPDLALKQQRPEYLQQAFNEHAKLREQAQNKVRYQPRAFIIDGLEHIPVRETYKKK